MAEKRTLLDSDGEDGGVETTFKVNEAFARKFEHNKKREDLHRLQELQKQGRADDDSDSEDDEEEDEDGLLPENTEVRIFDTLAKIKKKDPAIYKSDVRFFNEDEEEEEDEQNIVKKFKQPKPIYLKDVTAQHAFDSSDEEEAPRRFKTYVEEQEELKEAFLKQIKEAETADDEDGLFKVKKKSKQQLEQEQAEFEAEVKKKNSAMARTAEDYFGKDDALDENDRFLKDYLLNQGWIDKEKDQLPSYGDVSEEEEEVDRQDDYEAAFNFRFQEGAGSQVAGHSRIVDDSVRKVSDKRKKQRKNKQERLSEAETARREELKRLKNVKKKEIMEKIEKIKSIAGANNLDKIEEDYLEEDFDPEAHDKKMEAAFDEGYYQEDDPNANFHSDGEDMEMAKPDFDAEDEALGLEKGWDGRTDDVQGEIDKCMEEYYKLDYGDGPKFKYTQVKPNMYGLTTADILSTDDKELNQYISLKFLAPYRTDEPVPRNKYHRLNKKERKTKSMDQVPVLNNKRKKDAAVQERVQGTNKKHKEKKVVDDSTEPFQKKKKTKVDDSTEKKTKVDDSETKQGQVYDGEVTEPVHKKQKTKMVDDSPPEKQQRVSAEGEKVAKEDENAPKKKKGRSRKNKGLGLSQNRLLSYGKIQLPKRKAH